MSWGKYPGQALKSSDSYCAFTVGTVALMTAIFTWTIPRNTVIQINPTDFIAGYLHDAGAETLATDPWELHVMNAASAEKNVMISSGQYAQIKSFTDQTLVKRIGGQYTLNPDTVLQFLVKATTVIAASSGATLTNLMITCTKYINT